MPADLPPFAAWRFVEFALGPEGAPVIAKTGRTVPSLKSVAESDAFLDEHPDAYKDIDVVMRDSRDLVTVDRALRQIVNVKGD